MLFWIVIIFSLTFTRSFHELDISSKVDLILSERISGSGVSTADTSSFSLFNS